MNRYKPSDFESDTPPQRIMGAEMEYSTPFNDPAELQISASLARLCLLPPGPNNTWRMGSYFTTNGSKVYKDCNMIEYATPECLGADQVVKAEMAGDRIARRIAELSHGKNHQGIFRRVGTDHGRISNTNVSTDYTKTSGHHQNFLIPKMDNISQKHNSMICSYLASRVLWSGAGIVAKGYHFSQKAHGVGSKGLDTQTNRTLHGAKPLFLVLSKDASGEGWSRLEVRHSDAVHSPWVRKLGFAATSLYLRLIEHEHMLKRDIETLVDPYKKCGIISNDVSIQQKFATSEGREMTSIDYQQYLLEPLHELSSEIELPSEEVQALADWTKIIEDIKSMKSIDDCEIVSDRLEWAARYCYVRKRVGYDVSRITSTDASAVFADLMWDKINSGGIAEKYWQKRQPMDRSDLVEINRLRRFPPVGTRAATRVDAMHNYADEEKIYFTWDYTKLDDGSKGLFNYDPYQTEAG